MPNYKLIGTKPSETPDETIIRCANNLIKAVLASGRTICKTDGLSGIDVSFYAHLPGKVEVYNVLGGWSVTGKTPLKVAFAPPRQDLTQDDDQGGGETQC